MKSIQPAAWCAALAVLLSATAANAQPGIYECPSKNGHVYTQQPTSSNCRPADIHGNFATYSAPVHSAPSGGAAQPVAEQQRQATADNGKAAKLRAAKQALAAAEQALESGKQVRLGNERNYAKYQARIQGLENDVAAKKAAVQALEAQE